MHNRKQCCQLATFGNRSSTKVNVKRTPVFILKTPTWAIVRDGSCGYSSQPPRKFS